MDCGVANTIYQLSFFIEAYEQLLAGKRVKAFENTRMRIDRDRGLIFFPQGDTVTVNALVAAPEMCVDVGALRDRWKVEICRVRAWAGLDSKPVGYGNMALTTLSIVAPQARAAVDWIQAGYQAARTGFSPTLLENDALPHHALDLLITGATASGFVSGGAGWILAAGVGIYKYIRDEVYDKNPQCTFTKPPGF